MYGIKYIYIWYNYNLILKKSKKKINIIILDNKHYKYYKNIKLSYG